MCDYVESREQSIDLFEERYQALLRNGSLLATIKCDLAWLFIWRLLSRLMIDYFSPTSQAFHAALGEELDKVEEADESTYVVSELETLERISTQLVLSTLLAAAINPVTEQDDTVYRWLSRFLKRFEVEKRLYVAYTPEMRSASSDFAILANYALLSIVLLHYYQHTSNLKMLNGAVKLNDLLCSRQTELDQPKDLFLTVIALRYELDSIKHFATAKGVEF